MSGAPQERRERSRLRSPKTATVVPVTASRSTTGADDSGGSPTPASLDDVRALLAKVDELPVSERAAVLAAVNELLVAELAAMDEA